jgi:ATP-dependent Clp protease adaptor protein ClpS
MTTAHRRGACVLAVYTKDVAEANATNATDAGQRKGYPLLFTTEEFRASSSPRPSGFGWQRVAVELDEAQRHCRVPVELCKRH